MGQIGSPQRIIIVEPLELPVPKREAVPMPQRETPVPEEVPA